MKISINYPQKSKSEVHSAIMGRPFYSKKVAMKFSYPPPFACSECHAGCHTVYQITKHAGNEVCDNCLENTASGGILEDKRMEPLEASESAHKE